MESYELAVIGGGPAGISCARLVRRLKPDWRILVVRAQEKSVVPCALPYALDGTIGLDAYVKNDKKLFEDSKIDLLVSEVADFSASDHMVRTKDGREFKYGRLVLATGSYPFVPKIAGYDLKNVFTIKDRPDILRILDVIGKAKKAVVVGAGFIGLEMVNAFYNRGLEVTLVEKEESCLPNSLSSDFSSIIAQDLQKRGIKLFLGKTLNEIHGNEKVEECILDDGQHIEADVVILSIGVRPNVSLAKEAGINISPRGIVVDEYFQTNIADVYAIGDCVETRSFITGKIVPGYLATNAVVEGKYAALNISGHQKKFPGIINPVLTRIFDISCGMVGLTREMAERESLDFLFSDADVHTREKIFPGAEFLKVRMIFQKETLELIGAEVISKENVSWIINMLALVVLNKNTAWELATMQYCGHPPQIDVPSRMPIVMNAFNVLKERGAL